MKAQQQYSGQCSSLLIITPQYAMLSTSRNKGNHATSQCLNYHCSHIQPRQQISFPKPALNWVTNWPPGHFLLQFMIGKYDQKFLKMLNVITVSEPHLIQIKDGELPQATLERKKAHTKHPTTTTTQQGQFISFLPYPISCQVNLISLCFMNNHKNSPKAILYSQ